MMMTQPICRLQRPLEFSFGSYAANCFRRLPILLLFAAVLGNCGGSSALVYGGVITGVSASTTVRWNLLTSGASSSSSDTFVLEYQPPPVVPYYYSHEVSVWNLVGTVNVDTPFLVDITDEDMTNLSFKQQVNLQINDLIPGNFLSSINGVPNDSLSLEIETVLSFTLNSAAVIVAGQLGSEFGTWNPIDHAGVWTTTGIDALGTSISSASTPNLTLAIQDAQANGQSTSFAAGVHFVQLVSRVWTQNFDATGHGSVVAISSFDIGLTFAPFSAAVPEPSSQILMSCVFAGLLAGQLINRGKVTGVKQ